MEQTVGDSSSLSALAGPASRERLTSWILSTKEAERARHLIASEAEMADTCRESPELLEMMQKNGLAAEQVARQMYRTEWLKATLSVASESVAEPTVDEVRSYYGTHPELWVVAEKRNLSHILITVQDGYEENCESRAQERIRELSTRLAQGDSFASLALRYSECPTALEGGQLGTLPVGKLLPELEACAQVLQAEEVSAPVRTELGFHLLKCHQVHPEQQQSFEQVSEKLTAALHKKRQLSAQRRWVKALTERKNSVVN